MILQKYINNLSEVVTMTYTIIMLFTILTLVTLHKYRLKKVKIKLDRSKKR